MIRFNSWDGWELLEEYSSSLNVATGYLQGTTGVIKSWSAANTLYYYQDKLGSTTHVANASGQLVESYHYDLTGTPSYFSSTSQPINSSTVGVVDLYAGERWIPELALYDLRNRFMSPSLGRFLQSDPIGFKGDASNLYRYCGNDPVDHTDPSGLTMWGDLMKFFTGNPSMNVVLAAWTDRLLGATAASGGGGAKGADSAKQSAGASSSEQQNQPGVPDYAIRDQQGNKPFRDGKTHWVWVDWRITLYHHNQKNLGRGIRVFETIAFDNKVGFTQQDYIKGDWPTRDDGSVTDPWRLAFNRADGEVKVTQQLTAGGRQATWSATVHANGEVDALQYVPFH